MSNYKNENSKRQNNNEDKNDEHEKIYIMKDKRQKMPLLIFQILQVKVTNTRNEYKKTNNEIIKKY